MSNEPTPPAARPGRLRSGLTRAAGAAVIGLASAVAALGAGELVAYATGAGSAPVIVVGSAAIDSAPTPLKEYAVRTFGTHDKAVLLGGIYLTMALLAALAGLLAVRRPAAGAAVFGAFGAFGAWVALSRPGAKAADCAPSLTAGLVGAAAVLVLARLWRAAQTRPGTDRQATQSPDGADRAGSPEGAGGAGSPEGADDRVGAGGPPGADGAEGRERGGSETPSPSGALTGRRTLLAATAGTFAAGALAGVGGRVLTDRRFDVSAARDAVRLPAPAAPLPALPAAVHPNVPGLSPFTTANADFYRVDTALTLPRIDPRTWALRLHGLVDRPRLITFDELLREPLEELDHTLSCVSNEVGGPYVGTTRWLGAALPALLRRAGVRPGADQLVGRSKDGMTIGTPLESVLDGRRALLAVAMNGEALPVAHGFPCRTVVPGFYGYTSATKWLVELEVTTFAAFDPYWVRRGWDRTGTVRTASRIEVPAPFAKVPAGDVDVAGTAWATHRGIAAVELRIDEGPWRQAELAADAGPDLWRQWSYRWPGAAPGTHRIEVRATDATGAVQPESRAAPFPAGATGWHSTVVTVT